MKSYYLTTVAILASFVAAQPQLVHANTLVSTIDGGYDLDYYDTPSLRISNTTAYDFTGVSLLLQGYQGDNLGISQIVALGTIAAGTVDTVIWGVSASNGQTVPTTFAQAGQLFTYDYDDSYGYQVNEPGCAAQGYGYCAYVGNFKTTLTATWANPSYGAMGTEISSVLTPGK